MSLNLKVCIVCGRLTAYHSVPKSKVTCIHCEVIEASNTLAEGGRKIHSTQCLPTSEKPNESSKRCIDE